MRITNNQSKSTSSPPIVNIETHSTSNCRNLVHNEFQTFKFIDESNEIVTKNKRIHPKNKKLLLNRWVPPCVSLNDDIYVIDEYNYHEHYTVCLQKDIIKPTNYMEEYNTIQIKLALKKKSYFSISTFRNNKAFNIIDFCSGNIYECRILYAYYNNSMDPNDDELSWRVYIDHLQLNIVISTFLLKKLISSTYSNYIVQLILSLPQNSTNKNHIETKQITPSKLL